MVSCGELLSVRIYQGIGIPDYYDDWSNLKESSDDLVRSVSSQASWSRFGVVKERSFEIGK